MVTKLPKKPAKKNRLGTPPADASTALEQPEHAPAKPEPAAKAVRKKTGRTEPFGTRVSPEWMKEFKMVAVQDGLKHVELLEEMLAVYKAQREKA
ncbi:hypothetical protein [Octadecabacter ascidiaceicola]|uniref:Uncharacterized protein n=1 Tax=Octadecabacter ascidiaceicola TaxID=1655543 RepID=A0A238KS95_9RHOB|nr:hypothetical protein [Octadecabacter ascidiaceicola]SMX45588.1 hypothetical protein OCA8868_03332 [Octadecabacter ascidiaceicola]